MSEQNRSTEVRPYRMRKRAEQMEETRQRILDAAVHLHTTVGPASTTVSALAEQADVTRLTVYRHFPDQEALFAACGQQWAIEHPAPDPGAWRDIPDVETRARTGLGELYGWYRDNGDDLLPVYRDFAVMPATAREEAQAQVGGYGDALVAGTGVRGAARRRLRAAAGHAVSFWTWRSLTVEQGLDHEEAVDLAASLLVAAARRKS